MNKKNNFSRVLSRTLTTEFYRVNAMFFLVVIGFCFGFMRGGDHIALAEMFVSSPWLVLIPVGVWIAYTIKVALYNRREVRFERNWFLYSLPLRRAAPAYLTVAAGELAPAIAYGGLLASTALIHSRWVELLIIVFSEIAIVAVTSWNLYQSLKYPHKERLTSRPIRKLDQLFAKPMAWIFTEGILRSQPGMVYVTKIASCLVIYGATQLYLYDEYDERLYLMAACAGFSANLALVFQYQQFELTGLAIVRSLPISLLKRVTVFISTMGVLCLPEIATLFTNLPLSKLVYSNAVLFGFSLLVAGYGLLYIKRTDFDSFTRTIFFMSMGLLLLILFGVPVIIISALLLVTGLITIRKNFYSFHP